MTRILKYSGSVKNIWEEESNDEVLFFEFTDKYSIYDWGEMPDLIPNKGKALTLLAEAFFKLLPTKSHFISLEKDLLKVKKVHVPAINKYSDYQYYKQRPKNVLVPLEVIFRFGIPQGSSIIKRAENENYLSSIGINKSELFEGNRFQNPIIEFSTKLETLDRYLSYEEAQEISGLSNFEFTSLIELTMSTAKSLKEIFNKVGAELWDGKFEFSLNESRELILVDSIGPDELRVIYKEIHLSKEILRQAYQDSEWLKELVNAKKTLSDKSFEDKNAFEVLKNSLDSQPKNLKPEFIQRVSLMYQKLCDEIYFLAFERKPFGVDFNFEDLKVKK